MNIKRKLLIAAGGVVIIGVIVANADSQLLQGSIQNLIQNKPVPAVVINNRNLIRHADLTIDRAALAEIDEILLEGEDDDEDEKMPKNPFAKKDDADEEIFEKIEKRGFIFPTINAVIAAPLIQPNAPALANQWSHLGIKGAGVIRAVTSDSSRPGHLLMATDSHVYDTFDTGTTWRLLNVPSNNMQAVGIDPNNINHYLVLAGEKSLWESRDGGLTWALIHQFSQFTDDKGGAPFSLFWFGNTVYVRVGIANLLSKNNGVTWEPEYLMQPTMRGSPTKMTPNGFGILTTRTELFKTNNYGRTWNRIFTLPGKAQFPYYADFTSFDISNDGQLIYAGYQNAGTTTLSRSTDGGRTWSALAPVGIPYHPQDIVIDPQNLRHVTVFVFMHGLYESVDQGSTFSPVIPQTYQDMVVLPEIAHQNRTIMITPQDARFGGLKIVNSAAGRQQIMLPTDQGLFLYDVTTQNLKNIAANLYLGNTGLQLGITSCPTIYAGLWHVGNFLINSNGTQELVSYGEKDRAVVGQNAGCSTPTLVAGPFNTHYYEGDMTNNDRQDFLFDNFNIKSEAIITFYRNYWYFIDYNTDQRTFSFARVDKDFRVKEMLHSPTDESMTFYIDTSTPNPTYWIQDWSTQIWKSNDLRTWNLIVPRPVFGNVSFFSSHTVFSAGNILIWNNGLAPFGMYVSQNGGVNKNLVFAHMNVSNIVRDARGTLYVGVFPPGMDGHPYGNIDVDSDNLNMNGVWASADNGVTWRRYGIGTEKSIVTGLTIDSFTNTLYASTLNESIMKIALPPAQPNLNGVEVRSPALPPNAR